VFSLRRYFPRARIEGLDINPRNIAVCRRKLARDPDRYLAFRVGDSLAGQAGELYDAIFCMAVFRHGALGDCVRERCDDFIRFEDFERTTCELAQSLKRGGLLFIENCHFRFRDARAFADFEVIEEARQEESQMHGPIYDRNNRLTSGATSRDVVFRKVR
jgi:2-polyprenyl-3-methyl-5-hydroxy-6-metoxy-1,4-benzoquinol methylase